MKLFSFASSVFVFCYEQPKYSDFLRALSRKKSGWGHPVDRIAALYTLCSPLETPTNGQVTCDQSTCALVCDQGYVATGKRRTKCRFNQHKVFFWKRTLGDCETCPTDLAAPPAGVSVTCGINALNRKKCHYKCENGEKLQFSTGEALQFSAICACPRWNDRICGWHARKLGGMISDADINALSCGAAASTTAAASTSAAPPASSTAAPTTTTAVPGLSCAALSTFESSFAAGTFNCDAAADFCAAECADSALAPYPVDGFGCDASAGETLPTDGIAITCADTRCGNAPDFNYGSDWGDVTATCANESCALSCSSGTFPFPVDQVTCGAGGDGLSPATGTDIYCADSPCGNLVDFFNVDETDLTISCGADSCALSCPAGQLPSYLTLPCDSASRVFGTPHGAASNVVECVPEYETPCGAVESAFTMTRSDFNVTCSGLESIHQTTPVTCELTCADQFKSVVGDSTLVCENGAFTSAGSTITCEMDSTVRISADSAENTFAFNCPDDQYLVNGVTVPGWETFLTHSGTGGLFRMIENDWQNCYLAMTTNPASEDVEWAFQMPDTQTSLIQVWTDSSVFQPDAGNSVIWNFCVDDSCQEFDKKTLFNYTESTANSLVKIKATMTANADWKFAQLFRAKLDSSLFDKFEVRFNFII